MKIRSSSELKEAYRKLLPLKKQTRVCIGRIASYGYQKLNTLPVLEGHPLDYEPVQNRSSAAGFLRDMLMVRSVALPGGPVPVGKSGAMITEISTETQQFRHYSRRSGRRIFCFPPSDRLVTIGIERPPEAEVYLPRFSISTNGYARLDRDVRSTEPTEYKTPEALQIDYAHRFNGALAVAEVVADGLQRVYGIGAKADVPEIHTLAAKWQELIPEGEYTLAPVLEAVLDRF